MATRRAANAGLKSVISKFKANVRRLKKELAEAEADLAAVSGATAAKPAAETAAAKPAARRGRKPAAKKAAPKKAAAKKTTAKKTTAKKAAPKRAAAKKAAPKKAAAKKTTTRKAAPKKAAAKRGRKPAARKTSAKSEATGVNSMGIVDAAIYLANAKGAKSADAGQVLDWFKEANYTTRRGAPSRNSVYVSLNREAAEGAKKYGKGNERITRVDRGQFKFNS